MFPTTQSIITLRQRPLKDVNPSFNQPTSTFNLLKDQPVPTQNDLKDGEVIVRVEWCGIEPSMRAWLSDARGYLPPVKIDEVMRSILLGTCVATKSTKFKVGDSVKGTGGWAEYMVLEAKDLSRVRLYPGVSPLDTMGALGMTGMTAYFGMLEIGKPKKGETLVVSGAAGATGSVACQIGLILGCKVIAIAGSADKCEWLEKELGVHKAINYKDKDFKQQFKQHVGYLDVFYDNVGGSILNLALTRLNKHARIVLCGAIEDYNKGADVEGLKAYQNLIAQRGLIQGFIILDYAHRYREAEQQLAKWVAEGKLKSRTHIYKPSNPSPVGLENLPRGLVALFNGENSGKMVVQVWDGKNDGLEKSKL